MSKEAEKSENVVAMEIEESEEPREERLKQESIAIAIAGMCLKHPLVLPKAINSESSLIDETFLTPRYQE